MGDRGGETATEKPKLPKLRKVDGRLVGREVHEQNEPGRQRRARTIRIKKRKKRRQRLRNAVRNPVITTSETTVACRD